MKSKLILVIIVFAAVVLSGCGTVSDVPSNENKEVLESIRSVKGMEGYLDELSGMDYQGITEIRVNDVKDMADFYNQYIAVFKSFSSVSGWKNGAASTFLSYLPDLALRASYQEDPHVGQLDCAELLDYADYSVYAFTSSETDCGFKRDRSLTVIIEKGTELSDNPHIFIYQFERIVGTSRTDMMLPYSDKVYMDVTELNPWAAEDN